MIRKNNKGFTLVEVLAVVAILGILSVMVVPRIYDLVNDSRKNVYVQDAKKMITQARYTMSSKSVKIEKPENGECIIFSMKYLSVGDFQNPPNGGAYLPEASFVVVKNVNGEMIYSTMIVEKTKDGNYMGVALSTESALNEKNAITLVRSFDASEVAYVTEESSFINGGDVVNAAFINKYLNKSREDATGEWIPDDDDIIGYYNNDEVEENVLTDTHSPKVSAKFSSGEGSLQTTLTISASDPDNDTSELTVCVKTSRSPSESYPSLSDSTYCKPYGSGNFYTLDIDFEKEGYSYQTKETAYIYILVFDPAQNITRKRMSYEIHENEPPVVDEFTITKLEGDKEALPTATIKLSLSDDMVAQEDLEICFVQDQTSATSCSGYKPYSQYFTNGKYNYTFKSGGKDITIPDGSSHSLTVFVKDNMNLTAKKMATYTIYQNKPPTVYSHGVDATRLFNAEGNQNSLSAKIDFDVTDDLSSNRNLSIKFVEVGTGKTTTTNYEDYKNSDKIYLFSGRYDGLNRQLKVTVTDEYGATAGEQTYTLSGVYSNVGPVIETFEVKGNDFVCDGANTCYDTDIYGGGYEVLVSLKVSDDLTEDKDLLVCVSETAGACDERNKNTSNFVHYTDFNNVLSLSHGDLAEDKLYPTTQIVKPIYVAAIDSYGVYTTREAYLYKIYNNHDPYFTGNFTMSSASNNGNVSTVQFSFENFNVVDDFNSVTGKFCYKINGGEDICTSEMVYNDLLSTIGNNFEFKDAQGKSLDYNGQDITGHFEIKDNYGREARSGDATYTLFDDLTPNIRSFEITSSVEEYNNNLVYAVFKVEDFQDKYSVCVTTADKECTDSDYVSVDTDGVAFSGDRIVPVSDGEESTETEMDFKEYRISYDGSVSAGWDPNYDEPTENRNKTLRLFVKDSHGNETSQDYNYEVYKLCSNNDHKEQITFVPEYSRLEGAPGVSISTGVCGGLCYRNYVTTEDKNHIGYLEGNTNGIFGHYNRKLKYKDTLLNKECDDNQTEELHCDSVYCFNTYDETNRNLIGLKLYDPDKVWTFTHSDVTADVEKRDALCEDETATAYFNETDFRCENREHLDTPEVVVLPQDEEVEGEDGTVDDGSGSETGNGDGEGENNETPSGPITIELTEHYPFCDSQMVTYCTKALTDEQNRVKDQNEEMKAAYDFRVQERLETLADLRAEREQEYLKEKDNYNIQVEACWDGMAAAEELFETQRQEALTAYLNMLHAEHEATVAKCDELNQLDAAYVDTFRPICDKNEFCTILDECLHPEKYHQEEQTENPEDGEEGSEGDESGEEEPEITPSIACEQMPDVIDDEHPFVEKPDVFYYTQQDLFTCNDMDLNDEQSYVCGLLREESTCKDLATFDQEAYDTQMSEEFIKNYGDFVPLCDYEAPVVPDYSDLDPSSDATVPFVEEPTYITIDPDFYDKCLPRAKVDCTTFLNSFCLSDQSAASDNSGTGDETEPVDEDGDETGGNTGEDDESDGDGVEDTTYIEDGDENGSSGARKYVVPCDSYLKTEGPYWCHSSSITGQFCNEDYNNNTDCSSADENCTQVCYREVNCNSNMSKGVVTFVCHGYYKAYQSVKDPVDKTVHIQETGMRICPELYRYRGSDTDVYAFSYSTNTPYIKFNPDEIPRES